MSDAALLPDDVFLSAVLDCSLPAASFDHCAHLRVAWLMLQRHPLTDAIDRTCLSIARLAAHFGATGKYHRTLSEAFVRLISARRAAAPDASWACFLSDNPEFREDARALLARYYSPQRLGLPEARSRFMPPDRLPLPP